MPPAALQELLWFLSGFFLILFVALNWLLDGFIIGPLDKANAQLNEMAWKDPLTGCANRRSFMRRLDADLQRGAPVSVLMLDLDHFKAVNDHHGHAAGDRVLIDIGRLLARNTRASDGVGRLGGEEFAVVLARSGVAEAVAIAEGLRAAIERHAVEGVGRVSASVGCAEWDGRETASAWLARADFALYEAKRRGRNRVVSASAVATSAQGELQAIVA